jgi:hypothetical protein
MIFIYSMYNPQHSTQVLSSANCKIVTEPMPSYIWTALKDRTKPDVPTERKETFVRLSSFKKTYNFDGNEMVSLFSKDFDCCKTFCASMPVMRLLQSRQTIGMQCLRYGNVHTKKGDVPARLCVCSFLPFQSTRITSHDPVSSFRTEQSHMREYNRIIKS